MTYKKCQVGAFKRGFGSEIYGYRELRIWVMTHNLSKFIDILIVELWREFSEKVPR